MYHREVLLTVQITLLHSIQIVGPDLDSYQPSPAFRSIRATPPYHTWT
jgi:hypothetical protein